MKLNDKAEISFICVSHCRWSTWTHTHAHMLTARIQKEEQELYEDRTKNMPVAK